MYVKKIENIFQQMADDIKKKVERRGVISRYSITTFVIKIKDENLMFNLGNCRYLMEVSAEYLLDNLGHRYSYNTLDIKQFAEVTDYIRSIR